MTSLCSSRLTLCRAQSHANRVCVQRPKCIWSPRLNRQFHASAPANWSLEQNLVHISGLMHGIHDFTGLPWVATLSLTAILARTICITPFLIYQRKSLQRQQSINAVTTAWLPAIRGAVIKRSKEDSNFTPRVAHQLVKREYKGIRKRIYRTWKVKRFAPFLAPITHITIWSHFIEVVRRMCGVSTGWLWLWARAFGEKSAVSEENSTQNASDLVIPARERAIPLEPSFETDGALWFPNLLAPDMTLMLPIIFTSCFYLSIYEKRVNSPYRGLPRPRVFEFARRGLMVAPMLVVPFTWHIPSAIMVYMISSNLVASIQSAIIAKLIPCPDFVAPCRNTRDGQKARTLPSGR